jgi:hypothetical protein
MVRDGDAKHRPETALKKRLLTMRILDLILRSRALRGVSKDAGPSVASWFETAQVRLLAMRSWGRVRRAKSA